jgi:hypothetical protein
MARILLDSSSAHVRLALRVYFNVILLVLAFIGDQCCKKKSHLRLLRKQPLEITQATGWLRGTSALYTMYSMRRSPAGWLGFVMILAGIFWLVADLVVSGLVVTVSVVDRCHFNTTGPYEVMVSNHTMGPYVPGTVGTLWDIITGAQRTSKANGGLTGIFNKTNTDPLFRADAQDIMGRWDCQAVGADSTYLVEQNQTLMIEDLISRGLLYESASYCATNYIGVNWYTQFVAWSPSVADWSWHLEGLSASEIIDSPESHSWNVLAAVDMSPNATDAKVMRSFNCTMNAPAVEFVLGKVQASSTLQEYCENVAANIYGYFRDDSPPVPELGAAIASTLDTLIMMAGAYNLGVNKPAPPIPDLTQGCLATKTQIPGTVILVWVLITALTIAICFYCLFMIIQIRAVRSYSPEEVTLIAKHTPNGLLGWMKHAVRETEPANAVKYRDFVNWTLSPDEEMQGLHLAQKDLFPHGKLEFSEDEALAPKFQTILRKPIQSQVSPLRPYPAFDNTTSYAPVASTNDVYRSRY